MGFFSCLANTRVLQTQLFPGVSAQCVHWPQVCCRALGTWLGLILIDLTLIHFIYLYHWLNWVVAIAAVLLVLNLCSLMRTPHLSAARRLKKNKSVF